MFISGGSLVTKGVTWTGSTATWDRSASLAAYGYYTASYSAMYRAQLWVNVVVDKRAKATARLPLKTYERGVEGRREVREHPFAVLMRRPNRRIDPFLFWLWTSSTYDIFGEAFWFKRRDPGGRPVELLPIHPTLLSPTTDPDTGETVWRFDNGRTVVERIRPEDLVHFQTYNPDTLSRGLSKLEPLRATLENEDAARRATSSFWQRGARPGMALIHKGNLSQPAADRLKVQFDNITAGADNTGVTVVLEEGMEPKPMSLSAEEAQYIESRKLNREEVCGAYDIPPPVVHILDRATFSNITEQMRSMYRDTMAPHLGYFESAIETQLRGSVRAGATDPDFGDEVYAEFLLDEVLRGDFETRADAVQKQVNSAQRTPNEARKLDNLPPLPGGDVLYINSALIPIGEAVAPSQTDAADTPQDTPDNVIPLPVARAVMGRLGWQKTLADVDPATLTAGLNGHAATVLALLDEAKAAGDDVAGFRARVKATTRETP